LYIHSRSIATLFLSFFGWGGQNPDVVEAAGLAHYLGYPPFGYMGEHLLQELCKKNKITGSFEGNAQNFRIVCSLGLSSAGQELNLTRATLNAILKYPWSHSDGKNKRKWGYYDPEEKFFDFARKKFFNIHKAPTKRSNS
jgi:dGTPase